MFVVVSYREDGEHGWYARGHYDLDRCWNGDLQFHLSPTLEAAADYIAGRVFEEQLADYLHLVLESWEDVTRVAEFGLPNLAKLEKSVRVANHYVEDGFEEERLDKLWNTAETMVAERLEVMRAAAARKAAEEKRLKEEQEKKQAEAAKEERDRREYERLRTKYESGQ